MNTKDGENKSGKAKPKFVRKVDFGKYDWSNVMKKKEETIGTCVVYQTPPDNKGNYTTFLINAAREVYLLPTNPKKLGDFEDLRKILQIQLPDPAVQVEKVLPKDQ